MESTLGKMFGATNLLKLYFLFQYFCVSFLQLDVFLDVFQKTSLCDIQHYTQPQYPRTKALGGGPECFS